MISMMANSDISQVHEHHAEIQREVAAIRLEKELRANRGGRSRLLGNLGWELARYGGSLAKRLRFSER